MAVSWGLQRRLQWHCSIVVAVLSLRLLWQCGGQSVLARGWWRSGLQRVKISAGMMGLLPGCAERPRTAALRFDLT